MSQLCEFPLPSAQKRKVLEKTRKRQRRGVVYLLLAVVLIVIIAVGVYAYVSSLPPGIIYATLNTSKGTFEVELYRSQTPITVNNFVNLARSGFYNNLVWHRIEARFVVQTGDENTKNGGGNNNTWGQYQGTTVPDEIVSSLHNYAGYMAMANTGAANSGSTQFFINLVDKNSSSLDGKYTVFGRVISGMDVVNAIGVVPVYPAPPSGVCCQPKPPLPFLTSVTISNTP
ncbi:peptidylprolyl isomerase [Candidatus Bathyarchaeota archaeon]|nr:MAG: peptidylprolyl isomerase [Candidatus Bathyarchaeota archaeon]